MSRDHTKGSQFDQACSSDLLLYQVAEAPWAEELGNHRAVVQVRCNAAAVRAHVPWRRRDSHPEQKAVIVVDAKTGEKIPRVFPAAITAESGDIVFAPTPGEGEYYIYFMPVRPGAPPWPQATYVPPKRGDWQIDDWRALPEAACIRLESRTEGDRFTDMEVIATSAETEALLARYPDSAFLCFPEDVRHPIRMTDHLPWRWRSRSLEEQQIRAQRNEYHVFQIGVWAARQPLTNVQVRFAGFPEDIVGACFNTAGIDEEGLEFTKTISVPQGNLQALWCGLDIAREARPGLYQGQVFISADNVAPQQVTLAVTVEDSILEDRGDSEPWRHTKLRWLNSTLARDDAAIKPFPPLEVEENTISCLGRKVALGENGLPAAISSFFSANNTLITQEGRPLLAAPLRFVVEGMEHTWESGALAFTKKTAGLVAWESENVLGDLRLLVQGRMEGDGWLEFSVAVTAAKPVTVKDIRLEAPFTPETAKYVLGMGCRGSLRPAALAWKWDHRKAEDSLWLGDVNAGLRIQLKGENYVRPLVILHYDHFPLRYPPAWHNHGQGGAAVEEETNAVLFRAYSGPRRIEPGESLHFDFTLLVTPFKTLDTDAQWADRYFQDESAEWPSGPEADIEFAKKDRVSVFNIHHGYPLNACINYPFFHTDELRTLVSRIHQAGLRAKLYYTTRELTNHAPELFALRSLGDEVLAAGPGGGHQWLQEHLGGSYIQAWYAPEFSDVSVITTSRNRWHNLYLEGLRYLVENTGIDGLYIDDVAFDRNVMKRARKILDRRNPRALIDMHAWNPREIPGTGCANATLRYLELFPYIDRIWFGEGFLYNTYSPEFWLIEISGIPFGLMGEMLREGGNPWLGMLYGMTNRLGWFGDPRPLWKLWEEFGMTGCRMSGYWDPACPVRTGRREVLATVYQQPDKALLAIGNFSESAQEVRLEINYQALGMDQKKVRLRAPAIEGFQEESAFALDTPIPVPPKRGWLLILE